MPDGRGGTTRRSTASAATHSATRCSGTTSPRGGFTTGEPWLPAERPGRRRRRRPGARPAARCSAALPRPDRAARASSRASCELRSTPRRASLAYTPRRRHLVALNCADASPGPPRPAGALHLATDPGARAGSVPGDRWHRVRGSWPCLVRLVPFCTGMRWVRLDRNEKEEARRVRPGGRWSRRVWRSCGCGGELRRAAHAQLVRLQRAGRAPTRRPAKNCNKQAQRRATRSSTSRCPPTPTRSASSSCGGSRRRTRRIDIIGMDVIWTAEFAKAGWIKPWTRRRPSAGRPRASSRARSRPSSYKGRLWAIAVHDRTPSCSGTARTCVKHAAARPGTR